MAFPSLFQKAESDKIVARMEQLNSDTKPKWGKMTIGQMMAHCCVPYEYVYAEDKYAKPGKLKQWILSLFLKGTVVGEKPYKKNSPTAPDFQQKENKDFEAEKKRLIGFITKAQQDGVDFYMGRESNSFVALTAEEWNNMYYKNLDHHLRQFGV
jgi:hypothetical protein